MAISNGYDLSVAAVLEQMCRASDLEGLAILDLSQQARGCLVSSSVGFAGIDTFAIGHRLLAAGAAGPTRAVAPDTRPIIACPWVLPRGSAGGIVLWRAPGNRPWTKADHRLIAGLAVLLRAFLSTEVDQIGIDRQTGLPNRRWFIDEVDRHIDRLDRDREIGTLFLVDIDNFQRINAVAGRPVAERLLVRLAGQLRTIIRPGDVLARVGADEFAVWQNGMDHMTAAERADALCSRSLRENPPEGLATTVSVGIASRASGSGEDVRALLERARAAIEEVRGQGAWRVSHPLRRTGGPDFTK